MFNVTVIRVKDIVKILLLVFIVGFLFKLCINEVLTKDELNKQISFNNSFLEIGINLGSNIIKEIQKESVDTKKDELDEEENFRIEALKSVLELGSNAFNFEENKDLGQGEENLSAEEVNSNVVKEENQTLEFSKTDIITEVVTPNPLKETYSQEYNGVKIRNETSFNLSEDILNPSSLNIDKSNIIIFHTHTCESYTQSEKYRYELTTRKL